MSLPERPITIQTHLKCNWKVVMDAFAEAYHIPTLHRDTLKAMFSNSDNAFGRPLSTDFYGLHAVNSMFGNPEYMPQPSQQVELAKIGGVWPRDQTDGQALPGLGGGRLDQGDDLGRLDRKTEIAAKKVHVARIGHAVLVVGHERHITVEA